MLIRVVTTAARARGGAAPLFGRDSMAGLPNKGGVLFISDQTLVTHRLELVQHLTTSQPTGTAQSRAHPAESRAICARSRAISADARVESSMVRMRLVRVSPAADCLITTMAVMTLACVVFVAVVRLVRVPPAATHAGVVAVAVVALACAALHVS